MTEMKQFVPTDEAKGQAKRLRLFAILAWVIAIAGEIFAIMKLLHNDMLTWLMVAIVVILGLSIAGSLMWKKANRLDPASEKDKTRFFFQNQLGAIMAVLAFLPLVIFIFTNKDLDKKTKGIAGTIGIIALLIAGITGIDFNPPSVEKYTQQINEQTQVIKDLNNGLDLVYWTDQGNKFHIFEDCQHIKGRNIHSGTVEDAWKARKIGDSELCLTCRKRSEKAHGLEPGSTLKEVPEAAPQEAQ
ncbi:MAG TPA: hypothetical protein PKN57_12580 [Saprospiraceae bacterium]|nr:hypothetical protein [Saprospiraceae bacterium]HNJ17729.1 hypothetical protein [Saprospiraceae bacterium]HNJ63846.1 hypothetical protein [Saprospiraceae bacterium]HNL94359.1 hypothetical protein [Saprospiraceae bacterium]HNO38760.1 hypothetical protein [Saprospiraceae bacterium]